MHRDLILLNNPRLQAEGLVTPVKTWVHPHPLLTWIPFSNGMTALSVTGCRGGILSILRQFKQPNASSEIPWTAAKIRDPTGQHICPDGADP